MLAVWAITVRLKKATTVRWNEAFHFLTTKYPTASASPDAFSRALSNPANGRFFGEASGKYYLTPKGEELVEGWLTGKPVGVPPEESSGTG
jgi:hypothetical protein